MPGNTARTIGNSRSDDLPEIGLGDKFNQRFLEKGTKVEISEHLDRVLPPD